jgi:hypothetical protein
MNIPFKNQEQIMDVGVTCTVSVTAANQSAGWWLVKHINCSIKKE